MTDSPKRLSRRRMLALTGGAVGATAVGGALLRDSSSGPTETQAATLPAIVPFDGQHQAGILTPAQGHLRFASYDLTATTPAMLRDLLQQWTHAARLLTAGKPVGTLTGPELAPPVDTGEAYGLAPARLTLTFGFGPTLFAKVGLTDQRPAAMADLPSFSLDDLDPAYTGGDLCVQACADDPQVAFHAIRNLTRIGFGTVALRWLQSGFTGRPPDASTPRNLMGFKDGTANPDTHDAGKMDSNVWVAASDGAPWMAGGSYLVSRRVRIQVEAWDRTSVGEQEKTFGRHRVSGAPIGGTAEHDPVDVSRLPRDAHIRRANPHDGETSQRERILRRGYNFDDGLAAGLTQSQAGLFFLGFQRDPRRQFVPIQSRLAEADKLNEYILHTGSGLWAVPPGTSPSGYIGQTLLGSA